MAGMVGAGRTEVARCIVGADRLDAGTVAVQRQDAGVAQPRRFREAPASPS